MRYGTFHKCFTLWNIKMLATLFSENCHLLFIRLPMFFAGLLLYRDLLRYYRCCRIITFWCFPDMACFCVLSVFVSFLYVCITSYFKLLISLLWASFYRLRLFALSCWSDPLRYGVISVDSIYTAFNVFCLMVMYLHYLLFKIAVRALFWL